MYIYCVCALLKVTLGMPPVEIKMAPVSRRIWKGDHSGALL